MSITNFFAVRESSPKSKQIKEEKSVELTDMKLNEQEELPEGYYRPSGKQFKSSCWEYFLCTKTENQEVIARCWYGKCKNSEIIFHPKGSTSVLLKHLKQQHGWVPKPSNFQSFAISNSRQKLLERKCANMVAVDMMPFSIVEKEGFKDFVGSLCPGFTIPGRRTVQRSIINDIYPNVKSKVQHVISGAEHFCITSDVWQSRAVESYYGCTMHFIDNDWRMRNLCLGCIPIPESHTAANMTKKLHALFTDMKVDISKLVAKTHDTAAPMMSHMASDILPGYSISCAGHILNLVVQDALKTDKLSALLSKVRKITTHFHQSAKSTGKLLDYQTDEPKLKVIRDVITRWNSTYLMLERLVKLQIPITKVLTEHPEMKIQDLSLLPVHLRMMSSIVDVLKPFFIVTQQLCGHKYPTLSLVYWCYQRLIDVSLDYNGTGTCPSAWE